ncbi:MAG TPA: glycoside hydrolase family 97 protein [Paludibaculum sp.]
MIRPIPVGLCSFLAASLLAQQTPSKLQSPDGRLEINFAVTAKDQPATAGQLVYSLTFEGKPLIESSVLRLDLQGQRPLGTDVQIVRVEASQQTSTYKMLAGKTSSVNDQYNALRLDVEEPAGLMKRKFVIEARAYNDAVAFRYVLPQQPSINDFRLSKEGTEFRIAKDAVSYALLLPNFRSMYESEFVKLPLSAFSNQGGVASSVLLGLPLLLDVPGVAWLAITEADVRDYPAMYLVNPSGSWTGHWLEARLSPSVKDPELAATAPLPHQSPWRVLMVAPNPGRFIESNVITSLNPPSAIPDTSWIRPGRAAWDWWNGSSGADGKPAYTTATMKYLVDFAARSGFEYLLVDAGWSALNDITRPNGRVDIPQLAGYARAKGVGIWIWLHYAPVVQQMEEAFPLYEKWGVAGMKIDFISRDDQAGIQFYHRVAELAARHHLMVDFHGSTKPSGIERTWPNVMGYEAVLGMEQSKAGMRDNPDHHVTLPFTRMLTGLMDYTPGGFENATREQFVPRNMRPMVLGTRAHQLAMYAIYDAPIQMVADHPTAYEGDPSFEFIRTIPPAWDETRFLAGVPGEWIALARRRGEDWYLGAMTGWTPRDVEIPLSFLTAARYNARTYADAADSDRFPKNVVIENRPLARGATLELHLAPGGGFAARLTPVR